MCIKEDTLSFNYNFLHCQKSPLITQNFDLDSNNNNSWLISNQYNIFASL